MDDKEFAKMCEDNLKLGRPRPQEEKANEDPLLARPRSQEDEQSALSHHCHHVGPALKRLAQRCSLTS